MIVVSLLFTYLLAQTSSVAVCAFNVQTPAISQPALSTRLFSSHQEESCDDKTIQDVSAISNRRTVLNGFLTSTMATMMTVTSLPQESIAFDNKISNKYDDRPKRKGPQPKDLGVGTRKDMVGEEYIGLKPCGPAPNCFCSTDSIEDDPEHNIPAWKYPTSMDKESAFVALEQTVQNYKPGQSNIDGGGFQIVKSDPKKGYLYAQFEALKNGYIDDLEFAYIDSDSKGFIQVRSSSRVGYLDFGVNAKRLNYIAKSLREDGWDAPGVDPSTHGDYMAQNSAR